MAEETALDPSTPLRPHPGSPPPPRQQGEQVQAGRRGSSRTEALGKAAQHGPARSGGQHSRASRPQAWRGPHVTQCHRLRCDPKPGLGSLHTSPTGAKSPASPFLLPTLEARAGCTAIPGRRPAAPSGAGGS